MFLAFECVLSEIRPPGQKTSRRGWKCLRCGAVETRPESETEWFKAALKEAHKLVPLDTLTGPGDHTNNVKWVMNHMYDRERSALMHAKPNRGKTFLLPQDQIARNDLTASLGRLWTYLHNLIRVHYGENRRMFDFSAAAVKTGLLAILDQTVIVVSDDQSSVVDMPSVGRPLPDGSRTIELQPCKAASDAENPRLWTMSAHCDAADLTNLTAIRKLGTKLGDDQPQIVSDLHGPLTLGESVARFEVIYGVRYINPVTAPSQFTS